MYYNNNHEPADINLNLSALHVFSVFFSSCVPVDGDLQLRISNTNVGFSVILAKLWDPMLATK